MNPQIAHLIVSYDDGSQARFELLRPLTTIGRLPDRDIVLKRQDVSRDHAVIIRDTLGYLIENHSDKGTAVDGTPINQRTRLRHGSEIKLGRYVLRFEAPTFRVRAATPDHPEILDSLDATSTVQHFEAATVDPRQQLGFILEISRNLRAELDLDTILDRTLELLMKIFPQVDRAFVFLDSGNGLDEMPRHVRSRRPSQGSLVVSQTIFRWVMNEAKAILSTDPAQDERFGDADSIAISRVAKLMCVPLMDQNRLPMGLVQLDMQDPFGRFTHEDLELLVAVASQVSMAVENARLHKALLHEKEMLDAQAVQRTFLPESIPSLPGYQFWTAYAPAGLVGGDYYDYFPIRSQAAPAEGHSGTWLIALGDVVDKGMPAALQMAWLTAEVRLQALTGVEPVELVSQLNLDLCARNKEAIRPITFVLIVLDVDRHQMTVVRAGHPYPILRRKGGDSLQTLAVESGGLPLGVDEAASYGFDTYTLEPGDLVVLYTDGVTEAMNASAEWFGTSRLEATIQDCSQSETLGPRILEAVREHAEGVSRNDDLTLICFGRV